MSHHPVTARGEQTSLADRKRRAGQQLIVGWSGPSLAEDLLPLLRTCRPAGFLLRPGNAENHEHLAELTAELVSLLPTSLPPLCLAGDEGGAGSLVGPPATGWPPMRWLGNTNNTALCHQVGQALALEAAALGLNGILGPIADVPTSNHGTWIGQRSLGGAPEQVARQVAALVEGLQEGGLFACTGHFPGVGALRSDDPPETPVEQDLPELNAINLLPFKAAIEAGSAAIHVAHTRFRAWDDTHPASCSPVIIDLLRRELGFSRIIMGDDQAALPAENAQDYLPRAALAGVDLHLHTGPAWRWMQAFEILVHAQEQDVVLEQEMERSEARLRTLREHHLIRPPPPLALLGALSHRLLVERIRQDGRG